MRPALSCLALVATPALAETDASALIAAEGLRGAEAALAALPAPTPSERFALGGVRFLGGVERALQHRREQGHRRVGTPVGRGLAGHAGTARSCAAMSWRSCTAYRMPATQ